MANSASHPSGVGQMSSNPLMMGYTSWLALPVPVIGSLPRAEFAGWAVTK